MKKIIPLLLLGCFFFNFSYAQIAEGKPKEKEPILMGKSMPLN